MSVAKSWRFSTNLALLHYSQKHACQRNPISWSFLCGIMLFCLGLISLFTGHIASDLEWYSHRFIRPPKMGSGHREPINIWKSKYSRFYYGCSDRGPDFTSATPESLSNGYLLIATSGGLNQQRTGITDGVVAARILNATLVVPELDHNSFWKDDSDFLNIFDVNWFIRSLAKDVTIVKRVPDKVMRSMDKPPYTMRVPRKSTPEYYLDQVLPILLRRKVVQLTKFDFRLASDLDEELQKLRCRVNYHALRFTKPIRELGQQLVMKMRKMANHYVAVHLRFEPDMLAFSGCYYGGGDKERYELGEIRKRWATLPDMSPEGERKRGKCPLTPHEVGLMLRALGFKNDTFLYVASGEIYGGEETLQPLRELFPNFYTKEMLAGEELKPFLPFSSRLAALDYIVCDESDAFITNNNGNMAKILAGRRIYMLNLGSIPSWALVSFGAGSKELKATLKFKPQFHWIDVLNAKLRYMGHKRTIRPNAKRLSSLFMARKQMDWNTFEKKVKSCQRGFMGEPDEMRTGRGDFHEFPYSCICQKPLDYLKGESRSDQNNSSQQFPADSVVHLGSKYGRESQLQSLHGLNTSVNTVPVSSTEDHEDEDLFPD
ncbi:GDP-fucose protein O-fucosyltransferase [Dillenia turbinata]|uniref:O-fucosyltransferase family protein n=1 Tax=Dillenia turbinata TaxID=194707 RepID=A0AAN8VJ33_9MAGN